MFDEKNKIELDNQIKNSNNKDIISYLENIVFCDISNKKSFESFYDYEPEKLFNKITVPYFIKAFISGIYIEEYDEEDVHEYLEKINKKNFQYGLEKFIFLENYFKKYNIDIEQYKQDILDIVIESNMSKPFFYMVNKYQVEFKKNHLLESITGFPAIHEFIKEKIIKKDGDWLEIKNHANGNNIIHEIFSNNSNGFALHYYVEKLYKTLSNDNFILLCNEKNHKGNTPFMEIFQYLHKKLQINEQRQTNLNDAFAHSVKESIEMFMNLKGVNISIFESNNEGFNIYNAFKDRNIFINNENTNTLFTLINEVIIRQEAEMLSKSVSQKQIDKKMISRI